MIQAVSADLADGPDEIGGKAASLVRMLRLGLPVPPAFVVGTEVTAMFRDGQPIGFDAALTAAVADLERATGRRFGEGPDPLLVSVRSGAARSMPGMMDTVLNVGRPDAGPAREQLDRAVAAVMRSWNSLRARTFRRLHEIPDEPGTAVVVQQMVFGDRDDQSLTGVAFSRDPLDGTPGPAGEWLARAQGDDLVSGRRVPKTLATLDPCLLGEIVRIGRVVERDLAQACEIEFTVESGRLWLLQCRAAPPIPSVAATVAAGLVDDDVIDRAEAVRRVPLEATSPTTRLRHVAEPLTRGTGAGPGAVVGRIATSAAAATASAVDGPVILVRPETSPADLPGMVAAAGLLTARGGTTSHAAVVARSLGRVAVVGAAGLEVTPGLVRCGDVELRDGDLLSIDGTTGAVVVGAAETEVAALDPALDRILGWADEISRTSSDTAAGRLTAAQAVLNSSR